jgi:4-hydroxybenzoate polyprenyltransferase
MTTKKIFHWMVMSDVYASLIASGIAVITEAVLGLPYDLLAIAAVFFTSMAVYSWNRRDDGDIDAINVPERTKFVAKEGTAILVFSNAGFFLTMAYALASNIPVAVAMAFIVLSGFFYSFPLLRPLHGILGFSRLKEPLGVKNACASFLYAMFVLIPVFAAHAPLTEAVSVLAIFVFLRFFIVSTLFDLRDIEGDSKKDIRTIPVTYGRGTTLAFLHILNALTLVLGVAAVFAWGMSTLFLVMAAATFLYAYYYLEECRRGADIRHLCSVVIEADFVPALIVALAAPLVLLL